MGRDPSASEADIWEALLNAGDAASVLRAAILASGEGQAHTAADVTPLYDTYMGRDPSASELAVWQGLISGGDDFNAVRSAILGSSDGRARPRPRL